MRISGIIAEYNPFHNGHAHHVRLTREMSGCDYVVAVMSGAFTQRGEPAIVDKWARAEMALKCGVDVVIELPALFAVRPADKFALGGVSLLSGLGVDVLSFGCETSDLALLDRMSRALDEESDALTLAIRERLGTGMSHARARGEALCAVLGLPLALVNAPNTALALEYLRQNRHAARPMEPLVIRREGGYHDVRMGEMASATAIRAALLRGEPVREAMPASAEDVVNGAELSQMGALDNLVLDRIRGMSAERLRQYPDVAEGLEMRVKRCAEEASGRLEILELVKCKRYTMARLSRLLAHALMGLDQALCDRYAAAPYARVLGFRTKASPALREMKARAGLPIVTSAAVLRGEACFELERRATDLWGLTCAEPALRAAARDLTQRVLVVP